MSPASNKAVPAGEKVASGLPVPGNLAIFVGLNACVYLK